MKILKSSYCNFGSTHYGKMKKILSSIFFPVKSTQVIYLVNSLLSRNFCQKSLRVNFRYFYPVQHCNIQYHIHSPATFFSTKKIMTCTHQPSGGVCYLLPWLHIVVTSNGLSLRSSCCVFHHVKVSWRWPDLPSRSTPTLKKGGIRDGHFVATWRIQKKKKTVKNLKFYQFWMFKFLIVINFCTVWKLQDFSLTQLLREITFGESINSKNAVFAVLGTLNFVPLVNFRIQNAQKLINTQRLWMFKKWLILHYLNFQNQFHAKSEW